MGALGLVMPLLAAGGWLWWIHHIDKFEKEPWDLVLKTSGIGAGVGVVGLVVQLLLVGRFASGVSLVGAVAGALLLLPFHLAGIAGAMYYLPYRDPNWNEPFDGLVYGGAAGIGYGLTYTLTGLLQTPLNGYRLAIFSIPIFMLAGMIIGHAMSQVKFSPPDQARQHWTRGIGRAALYLVGIEVAQFLGGRVIAGNALAGMMAYGSNMLGWIFATKAMDLKHERSPFNPDAYRLQLAPTGCPTCGSGYPLQSSYCSSCGYPLHQHGEGYSV